MRWWGPLCTRLVGFFSAGSLKQQSADRHVAPLGHIILIPSQPVFALSLSLILGGKATNTNFIISSLTRSGLESTIYRTRGEHTYHYTTDVVGFDLDTWTTLIDKKKSWALPTDHDRTQDVTVRQEQYQWGTTQYNSLTVISVGEWLLFNTIFWNFSAV
jgi:hypothetical protein